MREETREERRDGERCWLGRANSDPRPVLLSLVLTRHGAVVLGRALGEVVSALLSGAEARVPPVADRQDVAVVCVQTRCGADKVRCRQGSERGWSVYALAAAIPISCDGRGHGPHLVAGQAERKARLGERAVGHLKDGACQCMPIHKEITRATCEWNHSNRASRRPHAPGMVKRAPV